MSTPSLTKLTVATGGLALSLTAGMGTAATAAADPDLAPAVDTTCNYSQVVAAMNAQSPDVASQLDATPMAQSFLQSFLASPPPQREQMLQQVQGIPEAASFVSLVQPLANTCHNYAAD